VAAGEKQDGELFERLKRVGIAAYYLANLKRRVNFYYDIKILFDLIKFIKKIKPDVLHLNSSKAGSIGAVAGKICGVKKIIYTVHGLVLNEPLSPPKKILYLLSEWLSAKCKHKIICVSQYDRQSVLKYKIAGENKILVIYNGIDLENIKLLSKEEAIQKLERITDIKPARNASPAKHSDAGGYQISDILVGTIANFYPSKGLVYLIEAAREVKQLKNNIKFIIIGDGRGRSELETMIANYKLNDMVYLPGAISNAKYYLKAFDLFVLPSIKEGLSYTLIEARRPACLLSPPASAAIRKLLSIIKTAC